MSHGLKEVRNYAEMDRRRTTGKSVSVPINFQEKHREDWTVVTEGARGE